jgi:hypothetical protein
MPRRWIRWRPRPGPRPRRRRSSTRTRTTGMTRMRRLPYHRLQPRRRLRPEGAEQVPHWGRLRELPRRRLGIPPAAPQGRPGLREKEADYRTPATRRGRTGVPVRGALQRLSPELRRLVLERRKEALHSLHAQGRQEIRLRLRQGGAQRQGHARALQAGRRVHRAAHTALPRRVPVQGQAGREGQGGVMGGGCAHTSGSTAARCCSARPGRSRFWPS